MLAASILVLDAQVAAQVPAVDPDAGYADRATPGQAEAAERAWALRLAADAADFEAAWKLARVRYYLGTTASDRDVARRHLDAAVSAGRAAVAALPARPEGHFWLAASMGALAESFGLRQGLKYRGAIKDALEKVLAIDPAFLQGSADRALGRWYFKVPGLFGGSLQKSEAHLRTALTYNTASVITHVFLAETLDQLGRKDEARREAQAALDAPIDPAWAAEDRRYQKQAQTLLERLGGH